MSYLDASLRSLMVPGILLLLLVTLSIFIAGCSFSLPKNSGEPSTALPPAIEGQLATSIAEMMDEHPDLTGVVPLAKGADAFAARMLLADAATTSIDTQYYIWRADLTGYLLLDRLKQAADRGVKIRLLLDDHGTSGLDPEIAALQAHPNVEVRLWNPYPLRRFRLLSFTFDFFRLNRRMHNKSFTVDGLASVLGGRNVGDEYFSTGETPLFVDLDVLVAGEVVPAISQDFDRYWNSPSSYPAQLIVAKPNKNAAANGAGVSEKLDCYSHTEQMNEYRQVLEQTEIVSKLAAGNLDMEWTKVKLISDSPAKGQGALPREKLLGGLLLKAVGTIENQFDGVSPYFVPGKEGVEAFTALQNQGVQVRMLTNSLEATDVLPVHAGYAKRRKKMLAGGIELFELRRQVEGGDEVNSKLGPFGSSGASLHAKTFAVDGKRIFVGSFNFDPRSARLNTEMGLLIDSERMASGLHAAFDVGLAGVAWQVKQEEGKLVWVDANNANTPVLTKEPGISFWRGVGLKVVGWLPIEWLL